VVYLGLLPLPVLLHRNAHWAPILKNFHHLLAAGLLVLVVAHIAAALEHHFIKRDDVLRRMLPRFR
jgi:cytochrome b561